MPSSSIHYASPGTPDVALSLPESTNAGLPFDHFPRNLVRPEVGLVGKHILAPVRWASSHRTAYSATKVSRLTHQPWSWDAPRRSPAGEAPGNLPSFETNCRPPSNTSWYDASCGGRLFHRAFQLLLLRLVKEYQGRRPSLDAQRPKCGGPAPAPPPSPSSPGPAAGWRTTFPAPGVWDNDSHLPLFQRPVYLPQATNPSQFLRPATSDTNLPHASAHFTKFRMGMLMAGRVVWTKTD